MHPLFRFLLLSGGLLCLPTLAHPDTLSGGEDLLDVYRLARDADPVLRRQEFELDVLREERRVVLSRLLPQVSLRGTIYRTRREQIQSGLDDRDSAPADPGESDSVPVMPPDLDLDNGGKGESAFPPEGGMDNAVESRLRSLRSGDDPLGGNGNGLDGDGDVSNGNGEDGNGLDGNGGISNGNGGNGLDPDEGDPNRIRRNFTQTSYGLTISQALLDFPARYQLRRGDSEVLRGEAELQIEKQALVARVVEAYISVLAAQSEVELARQELRTIRANLERVEAMYAEQMAALTDLDEIRARHDLSRVAVIRAQGALDVALEELSKITDSRHGRLVPLRSEADLPLLDPADPEIWVETAFENNPEIRAATQSVTSADATYRAARAQRAPTLDLVGRYSYLDDLDGTAFGRKLEDLAIGLELTVPLYAGGSLGAGARSALGTRESERQSLEAVRRSVRGQVRAAFTAVLSGRSQILALELAVRSSERSLEAVEAGYMAGLRPLFELLDAQRELFATRLLLIGERHEYVLQLVALRRAAGLLGEDDIIALNEMLAHAN